MLYNICKSNEIEENFMKVFTLDKNIDVLVGRKNGKLFAFNNMCPHKGASLSKGELINDKIICYMHGYEYNIFNGKLENMKSWKKDINWKEQNINWRKSKDLELYSILEENGHIYIKIEN
ncbi:MAG: Rieske (2Fe-2S) protein [Nitrososphaeraceae archaeon]